MYSFDCFVLKRVVASERVLILFFFSFLFRVVPKTSIVHRSDTSPQRSVDMLCTVLCALDPIDFAAVSHCVVVDQEPTFDW